MEELVSNLLFTNKTYQSAVLISSTR